MQIASELGKVGFELGLKAPFQDSALMSMLEGRKVGETPKGEASNVMIMKAWVNGHSIANLKN